jgi:hypothetical protein
MLLARFLQYTRYRNKEKGEGQNMITVLVALSVGFIAGFVTAFVWSHT